ncbi:hypothetical protein CWS31_006755 [Colwellia echini]|uniref:Tetratricopeptide repeat-containing protein n=1 Tax=Colwellia echini TaxID=1982103 RepID=A0ABY3MYI5_9GAMM|nr:hypothetical protein CWS31_006755 [Colwellia echini]
MSCNSTAFANDEADLAKLKAYILAKEYSQAYDFSKSVEFELAGDITYDFLSGVAAFGAKRYQTAVFSFERVLISDPTSFDARYYLALSYQRIDNLHAAVSEFETLSKTSSITAEQTEKVEYHIKSINQQLLERTRLWTNTITFGLASDSNINSGSSLDDITLPDGTVIPLFDASKEIADGSVLLQYSGNYQYTLSQNQTVMFDVSARSKRFFDHSEYNRELVNLSVSYQHELLNEASWYVGLSTTPLWFANDLYRTENALSVGWQQPIDNNSQYGLNAVVSQVDHATYDQLNFNRYIWNAFYRFFTDYQYTFMLKGYHDDNTNGLTHNNKTAIAGSYTVGYPITANLSGSTMVMFEKQTYEEPNPLFNELGDSSSVILSTDLLYSGFQDQAILLQLNFQDKSLESELLAMKIFEYDRLELNLTWNYTF